MAEHAHYEHPHHVGTDVAVEAGNVLLVRSDPRAIPRSAVATLLMSGSTVIVASTRSC